MLNYNREIDLPNYGNKIFLNNAGSSLMPFSVRQVIKTYLDKELEIGGYKLADQQEAAIEQFYQECAKLLNCQPKNIAFAHDATDAYIKALSAIPFEKGEVIITSTNDYSSNQIQFISLQKRYGILVKRIRSLESAICEKEDILFLVDACQSVGQLVVDVQQIKCDFLSATGRKFLRGPRGTGLLYVSDKVLDADYAPLLIDGWGAKWTGINEFTMLPSAKRFETWERSFALVVGLAEAIRIANEIGLSIIEQYNNNIQVRLRSNLSSIKGIQQYDYGSRKANLITFRKEGIPLEQLKKQLDAHQIYYSVSTFQWGIIDFKEKGVDWVIRLSPHYFNTLEEMDRVAEVLG